MEVFGIRTDIKWGVCYDARRSRCKGNLPGDASSLAGKVGCVMVAVDY